MAAASSGSRPGLRLRLQVFTLARGMETTLPAQLPLPFPGSANARDSITADSLSLPWKNRDQE